MHRTCPVICAFFFLFPSLVTILGQSGEARDAKKDQAAQTLPMFHIMKPITIRKFNRISQHIPLPVGNYFSFLSDFNEKMPHSVAFTWFPMWWFFFDLCMNSTTLKVVCSSNLRCSVESFSKKLLPIFLHACINTERGIERHLQTLQCLSKLLKVFNSGTFLELDQSLYNLYTSVQLHISNFEVLGMSVTKNTLDTFVFLLHTCSCIFQVCSNEQ